MRRGLLTATLLGVMFTVSACSGNKDVVSDESSELLAKPDVTQASAKGLESGSADSDSTSVGKFKKIQFGDLELYLPDIAEADKKRGVKYVDDAYSLDMDLYEIHKKINKPDGMKIKNADGFGIGMPYREYSEELQKQVEEFNYTVTEVFSDSATIEDGNRDGGNDAILLHEISAIDVLAISFAIYEDFFDSVPDIKLSIYGIPHEVWNKYLSADDRYSRDQNTKMLEAFRSNGYSECDLIADREIKTTDVYYMDYAGFNKDNRYKQFLMVLEMEDIPCEYSFYISEGMGYVMDEGGESAYAAWKEANKNKFIE